MTTENLSEKDLFTLGRLLKLLEDRQTNEADPLQAADFSPSLATQLKGPTT